MYLLTTPPTSFLLHDASSSSTHPFRCTNNGRDRKFQGLHLRNYKPSLKFKCADSSALAPPPPSISVPVSRRAAVCHLIRLFSIQEESSALKCSQYYAFNSFPPGPVGAREEAAEERARQKTEGSLWSGGRERESEVSQDKSPLLNSRHDSLDNYLHHPASPLSSHPRTHLKGPSSSSFHPISPAVSVLPPRHSRC